MPNAKPHMLVGTGVGLTAALLDNNKHPASHIVVVAPAVGAFMGILPDILAPAFSWKIFMEVSHERTL